MFSLPSLDSSITDTRDTSDKRQLTHNFARIFLSCGFQPFFFPKL